MFADEQAGTNHTQTCTTGSKACQHIRCNLFKVDQASDGDFQPGGRIGHNELSCIVVSDPQQPEGNQRRNHSNQHALDDERHLDEGVGRTHQTHNANFLAAGEDGDFDGVGNDDHRNDCQNQHDDSANGRNCLLQIGEDGCLLARRADVRVYPIDFQQLLLNRIEG